MELLDHIEFALGHLALIKRAQDRVTFGKPLSKRQAIQQTIADMDKGSCQYWVTFDGTITEAQAEADDGGACIADYKVSAVEYAGVSDEVLDPGVYD